MVRPCLRVLGGLAGSLAWAVVWGCTALPLPDPKEAAAEFAAAVARGDARALHGLMTDEARRAYGEAGTARLLADARAELARQAASVSSRAATVRAGAEVPYADGERAVLLLEDGRFRVSSAAGLPGRPRTPAAALAELRSALARRSYPALLRALSSDTQSAVDGDLRSLVTGLERPDTLHVVVRGETAEVEVPGGHKVVLKREAGVWRVHDFD